MELIMTSNNYPSKDEIEQLGLWWKGSGILADYRLRDECLLQEIDWECEDVNNSWLFHYYLPRNSYYHPDNLTLSNLVLDQLKQASENAFLKAKEQNRDITDNTEVYAYAIWQGLAQGYQRIYWNDTIEGFASRDVLVNDYEQFQSCSDEMFMRKPEFIVALVNKYCETWSFNKYKSTKSRLFFDRRSIFLNDYIWHIIIDKSSNYDFNRITTLLVSSHASKLQAKDVLFQIRNDKNYLWSGFKLSQWKSEINFQYQYIERYINWLEPRFLNLLEKNS